MPLLHWTRLSGMTLVVALTGLAGCTGPTASDYALRELPDADRYCLAAQRVVTRTLIPVELVVHEEFDAFVSSKAIIDGPNGPQIQQFNWYDDAGRLLGISCKLKSADHLNLQFGEGSAGPDGACQEMNQAVFSLVSKFVREPAYRSVVFDPAETVSNEEQPGMTGPDWLAPYRMTYLEGGDTLHIAAKGFIVNFTDPRFARAPERFRGVQYCHFIAPGYLAALLRGEAKAGVDIGQQVDPNRPNPGPAL